MQYFLPSFLQKYTIWLAILDITLKAKTVRDDEHSLLNRSDYFRIQCFNLLLKSTSCHKRREHGSYFHRKDRWVPLLPPEGNFLYHPIYKSPMVVAESFISNEVQIHIRKKTDWKVIPWERRYTYWKSIGLALESVILYPHSGLFK